MGWGQETAFAMLAEVTERALALTRAPHLLLVGGVACEWAGPVTPGVGVVTPGVGVVTFPGPRFLGGGGS